MTHQPNSTMARDQAHVLHPTSNLALHKEQGSLVIERGKGVYVYDEAGKSYMDGLASAWCVGLGYGEDELADVAAEQMRKLPYFASFANRATQPVTDLAEKLKELVPFDMSKVFFVGSGSEANDTQIKLAWYYNNAIGRPEKKKIISRTKAYHGVTLASASLTGLPPYHRDWDLPIANVLHADCPHHYRFAEDGESEQDFSTRLADNLNSLIESEGPETVAAFIAEPVMGAGGVMFPPETYFEKIQPVLKKHDVLFIADEVITGFGRTGNMFGCETYNIVPDTLTIAKQMSSAYLPIAAIMIPEFMYDVLVEQSRKIGVFGHGYTYGGHVVAAAVALRTLEIYEERNVLAHVHTVAAHFDKRISAFADHPLVGEAKSKGLLGRIELVADKATKQPFEPAQGVGIDAMNRAQENGLLIRAIGDTLAFCPPMVISESEIDEMFDIVAKTLDATEAHIR